MGKIQKLAILVLLLAAAPAFTASAQYVQSTRKYRVVAYKNGNPAITSTSNEVEVQPYMSIYIPNTFTPNGDGMNDTFGAYGEAIKDFNMQIFNRWGQVIFETTNVNNRWDGTHEGEKVQEGVYVYRVQARGPSGKPQTRDGNVNIVY